MNGKKNPIILIMGIVIVLLCLALIFTATPLKKVFFASKASPELALELVSEPVLEENGKYRFEVVANVSGNPNPDVIFNRDDSLGEAGENRVIIFLDPGETFSLTAVAKNSQGQKDALLELAAGIETANNGEEDGDVTEEEPEEEEEEAEEPTPQPAPNQKPVITGITFPAEPMFQNNSYSIRAQASDPDGDSLTYRWEVSGPGFSTITASSNPMTIRTPAHDCTITVKVTVRDGKGGETTRSQQTKVNPVIFLGPIAEESGSLVQDTPSLWSYPTVYAGDTRAHKICRAFISIGIDSLQGTVHKVELRLPNPTISGNPIFMHADAGSKPRGLWIEAVYWGTRNLQLSDYYLSGTPISSHTNYDITRTSVLGGITPKLAEELQRYLDEGKTRFQLRLRFENEHSNNDDVWDGVEYVMNNISLGVFMVE